MACGAGAEGISAPGAGTTKVAFSKTLPALGAVRAVPKYASIKVLAKKIVASTAVVRDRKLALPEAPNKLPEPPLPNAASQRE